MDTETVYSARREADLVMTSIGKLGTGTLWRWAAMPSIPRCDRDAPVLRSKNLFLTFGTRSEVTKNRSDANTHISSDRLPAEPLSAKCGNPLLIEDALGTA